MNKKIEYQIFKGVYLQGEGFFLGEKKIQLPKGEGMLKILIFFKKFII
jgi:hypothetical protein